MYDAIACSARRFGGFLPILPNLFKCFIYGSDRVSSCDMTVEILPAPLEGEKCKYIVWWLSRSCGEMRSNGEVRRHSKRGRSRAEGRRTKKQMRFCYGFR